MLLGHFRFIILTKLKLIDFTFFYLSVSKLFCSVISPAKIRCRKTIEFIASEAIGNDYFVGFVLCLQIFAQWPVSLILYIKKGTALTIPYSGKPERPRRSNYPFNGGFVSQKTLVSKCESAVFISLLTYIIHIFQKKSTGNIYKIFFLNQMLDLIIQP